MNQTRGIEKIRFITITPLLSEELDDMPAAMNIMITLATTVMIKLKPNSVLLIRPSNENGF